MARVARTRTSRLRRWQRGGESRRMRSEGKGAKSIRKHAQKNLHMLRLMTRDPAKYKAIESRNIRGRRRAESRLS